MSLRISDTIPEAVCLEQIPSQEQEAPFSEGQLLHFASLLSFHIRETPAADICSELEPFLEKINRCAYRAFYQGDLSAITDLCNISHNFSLSDEVAENLTRYVMAILVAAHETALFEIVSGELLDTNSRTVFFRNRWGQVTREFIAPDQLRSPQHLRLLYHTMLANDVWQQNRNLLALADFYFHNQLRPEEPLPQSSATISSSEIQRPESANQ